MMVVPFEPKHLRAIDLQDAQIDVDKTVIPPGLMSGLCVTFLLPDKVLLCCGVTDIWNGRSVLWAVVSKHARSHMLIMTRRIEEWLRSRPGHRFEIIIKPEFTNGIRWAMLLGFEFNCYERRFLPNGGDAVVYVRFT